MSLPNSNWFFQTILKSFQSHVTNMLDRHPWLFVNFRHGLHRYSNSLTVFECAGDRQKDTMFSTQLHVLHAFCLLTVYSEPSYSPASARSESFVCRPCFSWCLFACHCTPSNQFVFCFGILVHVTPACGQVHFFPSFRFAWYASSLAWEGQDWIDQSRYSGTCLLDIDWCEPKSKKTTMMKLMIEIFCWDYDVKPF